jgi:tetratricopeptide (TPR) repeat protein
LEYAGLKPPSVEENRAQNAVHLAASDDEPWGAIQQTAGTGVSGTVDKISSFFQDGVDKVTDMLVPPSTSDMPIDDPTSLSAAAKPTPKLHVAMARLWEQSGKVQQAEQHYQQALALDASYLDALIGYARLKDRQGEMVTATRLYQQATQAHPNNPSVFNHLGLCLARRRMFNESLAALDRAVRLAPEKHLYRNNIAMVLVETARLDQAVAHLKAVQSEAVAYYNVGYILKEKGDLQLAARFFAQAARKDPGLAEARVWLIQVQRQLALGGTSTGRIATRPGDAQPRRPATTPRSPSGESTPVVRPLPAVPGLLPHSNSQLRAPSAKAPLPPSTSAGKPYPGKTLGRPGIPVVHPLPPVETSPPRR